MDVGPNVFLERGTVLETGHRGKVTRDALRLRVRLDQIADFREDRKRLTSLSEVLREVDESMARLDGERTELLDVRNQAMGEASLIAGKLATRDMRRVLFHILDEHDRQVDRISEALNLRELTVKTILEELEKSYFE